jgi:hypothetical protein
MKNEIRGKHSCQSCNKSFDWMIIFPDHVNASSYTVHTFDSQIADYRDINENEYEITVRCKHCDERNRFTYNAQR